MQTFFTKVSSGITGGLATLSLSLLGYKAIDDTATSFIGTQTEAFDTWIWPLVMLTPVIASVLYIIPLLFIKYPPEKRAQVERELAERRSSTN
jgi:Na+/melibiose symporter-like transporter